MRDDDPKVKRAEIVEYLQAENAHTEAMLAPLAPLRGYWLPKCVLASRRTTAPCRCTTTATGLAPLHYRRRVPDRCCASAGIRRPDAAAPEEVLLDIPELARGHAYFSVGALAVSPDNRWLAYTEDTVGRRMYTLRLRDLMTGAEPPRAIGGVLADVEWAADRRPCSTCARIRRHWCAARSIGTCVAPIRPRDVLVYDESGSGALHRHCAQRIAASSDDSARGLRHDRNAGGAAR